MIALDNLRRRGSELNLRAPARGGRRASSTVTCASSTTSRRSGEFDALVECSAEPSVMAGVDGGPDYVVQTNLRRRLPLPRAGAALRRPRSSSSRPAASTRWPRSSGSPTSRRETRFELATSSRLPGASARGRRASAFPLDGARTLYGATKLAAELLIDGVRRELRPARPWSTAAAWSPGPGRWARSTRASSRYWMLAHHFGRPLRLHRLRRHRQAGPRPAARRGSRSSWSTSQLGDPEHWAGRHRQRRRRARRAASRCARRPRCAARSRAATIEVGATPSDAPGRRPDLHLRLHAGCSR